MNLVFCGMDDISNLGVTLPAWPRVTGKGLQVIAMWQIVETPESIAIVPTKLSRALLAYFAFLGLAAVMGVQVFLYLHPAFTSACEVSVLSVVMALFFAVVCFGLKYLFAREQVLGPTLVVCFSKKEVRLPRVGRSWPIEKVIRFDIVCGKFVRYDCKYFTPYKNPSPTTELQMVVTDGGESSAWPLVSVYGCRRNPIVSRTAETLGKRMGLPIALVNDDH
jgi:hypothetical protein